MRINDIFFEAPLPPDWDVDVFSPRTSFKAKIDYAKERAKQIGKGSSRVAFLVPYQGRMTVLKIALNNKGLAQNEEEVNLLSDWYLKGIGITIPMIDYDERNARPTWIHTEYAQKITQKQLEKYFGGVPMRQITMYLDNASGKSRSRIDLPEEVHENEYFQMLQDLVINFGIPAGDFSRKANWGIYKGSPVIIDLGYTDVTEKLYR